MVKKKSICCQRKDFYSSFAKKACIYLKKKLNHCHFSCLEQISMFTKCLFDVLDETCSIKKYFCLSKIKLNLLAFKSALLAGDRSIRCS